MSELNERLWAVISERGREAEGLAYAEAGTLARQLRAEKLSGLCVVTDAAASHLRPAAAKVNKKKPAGSDPKGAKRSAKNRAT
ncbi:MAG: hypothetical protein H7Z38_02360 [Rubrivivax sp.]|nr:hypothetical protein [Pyrinomonadaceae bacterium]